MSEQTFYEFLKDLINKNDKMPKKAIEIIEKLIHLMKFDVDNRNELLELIRRKKERIKATLINHL